MCLNPDQTDVLGSLHVSIPFEGDAVLPHSLFPNPFLTCCLGVMSDSMPVLGNLLETKTPISATWLHGLCFLPVEPLPCCLSR